MELMTIILPLGALLIALLIIAALWLWWSGDRSEEPQAQAEQGAAAASLMNLPTEAPNAMNTPPIMTAPTSSTLPLVSMPAPYPPAPALTTHGNEILRVARADDGRLSVMFASGTYHTMSEMDDPDLRQQFMSTLRALALFTQDVENGAAAPDVPALTTSSPASVVSASQGILEAELAETPPDTMAAQIESLLQARLVRTPGMHQRAIHIYGAPGGGVQISVDGTCFDSVGDITDPEARAVIEAAIRDWEAANPL